MALPFLSDKNSIASVITAERRSSDQKEGSEESENANEHDDLHAIARELIDAIHAKDASAVAEALRAAQAIVDLDE